MSPDLVNGCFEMIGASLLVLNVKALYKDKAVAGVRVAPTAFFALWGWWNLYYYPSLGQWFSFAGGVAIVSVNCVWVVMAIHYSQRNKQTN